MTTPKITVYVVSHNYGRFLETAIESVLKQSIDDWELMIFNDNSIDNTSDVMNLYKGDDRIRLITTQGIGLPSICNIALRESRGEYIIRLDGDDIFEENILLVLCNYLDRHPKCALVFPDYYLIDESGEIFAQERREKVYVNNHVLDSSANGACSLIRKKNLKSIGGYREDLGMQDGYDIWNKLIGRYKIGNVNIPLFYYRRHSDNLTNRSNHILRARHQIKFENIIDKLDKYRPITAVIPCRRNYDFCSDVWKQKIQGKSLLQRCIEKCIESKVFDNIVVTSNNPEVQDVMSIFQDNRLSFNKRQTEMTSRSMNLIPTLEPIVDSIDPDRKGVTVIAYIQAPFVTTATLEESIFTLILSDADCAFGVEELRVPLYKRTAHGLQPINPSRGLTSDFDIVYQESNTSLASKNRNFKFGSLTGPSVVNFNVYSDECFFINSERSLDIAKIIAKDEL